MRASAELEVGPGDRLRWSDAPPVVLRRTGRRQVHLVAAAGGPLGGDDLHLHLRLAEDAELTVASAAATIAQPGRPGAGPARWTVIAELATGARLTWIPEPTVICDGAELHARLTVRLAAGAGALLREQVQLGRHGERGGRYRGGLAVDHGGVPLLRHTTVIDGDDPGLSGPAGTAGARVLGSLVGAGRFPVPDGPAMGERGGTRWARHGLPGAGWLLLAVGEGAPELLTAACRTAPVRVSSTTAAV